MVWLVVAGKPDHATPSNMVGLGDGRLNVNSVSRRCEARSRSDTSENKFEQWRRYTTRGRRRHQARGRRRSPTSPTPSAATEFENS
ncbi:hypothetical protein EVAR_94106_1 [Eumeta japonica]|uniref:Uncharacterized protein n=1 Tax=Eumeta variegata TaxID=151549 RepID=A0A4C1U6X2_EUMVA|nr:hypothetical protein EVAR_94106_1 [Eumeta japonica]